MPQQTFSSGDAAPVVRSKLNANAGDVDAHVSSASSPHGTSLTQANLTVTNALIAPNGTFVRSLGPQGDTALTDHITLSAGAGVQLTREGQDIEIGVLIGSLIRVCCYPRIVINDLYGDGYLSIPCDDTIGSGSFEPQTGAAGFIACGLAPDTGSSYEGVDHIYAYPVDYGEEGEPYDSLPMVWYDGAEYVEGEWRMIVTYRNIGGCLPLWCRAERIG